jgi:hypothetical protein
MMFETDDIEEWTGRFGLDVLDPAEDHAADAHDEADHQDGRAAQGAAHERHRVQVRDLDVGLASANRRNEDAARAAAAPNCQVLGDFMLRDRGLD